LWRRRRWAAAGTGHHHTYRVRLDGNFGDLGLDRGPQVGLLVLAVVSQEAPDQSLNVRCRRAKYLSGLFFAGLKHRLGNIIAVADPLLAVMGGRHPIAGAVEQIACQEERCGLGLGLPGDSVGCKRGLDSVKGLHLTQEFIAEMLGVQRTHVTSVVGILDESGAIRKSRGTLTVINRGKLEQQACECYAYLRRHFERVLPGVYPKVTN